jgi:hypothetical protein
MSAAVPHLLFRVVLVLVFAGIVLLLEAVLAVALASPFGWGAPAIAAYAFVGTAVIGLLVGTACAWKSRRTGWSTPYAVAYAFIVAGLAAVLAFPVLRETGRNVMCIGICRYGLSHLVGYVIRPDDAGRFPTDVQGLFARFPELEGSPICPGEEPSDFSTAFVYIPNQRVDDDRRNVLIYERSGRHHSFWKKDGGNVLFLDMHHEWVEPYSRVLALVEETKARLAARAVASRPSAEQGADRP